MSRRYVLLADLMAGRGRAVEAAFRLGQRLHPKREATAKKRGRPRKRDDVMVKIDHAPGATARERIRALGRNEGLPTEEIENALPAIEKAYARYRRRQK